METLLLGADPKLDVEYGKVCCKMASGKEILLAERSHTIMKISCGLWPSLGRHFEWTTVGSISTKNHGEADNECRAAKKMGLFSQSNYAFVTWQTLSSEDIDIAL